MSPIHRRRRSGSWLLLWALRFAEASNTTEDGRVLQAFEIKVCVHRIRILPIFCNVLSIGRGGFNISLIVVRGDAWDAFLRHRDFPIHKVSSMLRLRIPDFDTMLVHVPLDLLAEPLQFGVLLLQLLLLGLKHGDHIETYLNFLSFRQFELTLPLLRR